MPKKPTKKYSITIQNIVATSSIDFKININKFSELNDFTIDENYPVGVHCRNKHIIGLVTVYRTGKMITVGAKTEKVAKANLEYILNLLKKQRKKVEIKT